MNINTNIIQEKVEYRKSLSQIRSRIEKELKPALDQRIHETVLALPCVQKAESIFCFISFGSEVDTHALLQRLLADKKQLAVPRILHGQGIHAISFHRWDNLQPGELGILTPVSETQADFPIDVCITPGLGFTTRGERLGFGRGYYDRWFSANPSCYRLALAYECQVLPYLPADATDFRVNCIVTEQRLIEID